MEITVHKFSYTLVMKELAVVTFKKEGEKVEFHLNGKEIQKLRQKNPTVHVCLVLIALVPEFPLRGSLYMIVLPRIPPNGPHIDFLSSFLSLQWDFVKSKALLPKQIYIPVLDSNLEFLILYSILKTFLTMKVPPVLEWDNDLETQLA